MTQAFAGVRVIDFSQVLAGPFCTAQLALLGADVIKIEHPKAGDQGRLLMADEHLARLGLSPIFLSANAGKRSITLDLKHPAAAEVVHRLVRAADVVVENFKAGTMDRMGFGYAALKAVNPRLIYCSVSGYGQKGPKAGVAAYDGAVQAASGLMSVTGHPETGPVRAGFTVVDLATGLTAAYAVAGALYRRRVTGEGQHLDVAMLDTSLTMLAPIVAAWTVAGVEPELLGNLGPARQPTADSFRVRDGHMLLTVLTQAQFEGLCRAIGREDLAADPRYATGDARKANGAALKAEIEAAFAAENGAVWQERLGRYGIAASPIRRVPEVLEDPQLAHRVVLQELPPPQGLDRNIKLIGAGFTADADPPGVTVPPPALGQHTDEILRQIGYGAEEITALRQTGAI